MKVRDRVRFKHPVDRFPLSIPAGATGELVTLDEEIAEVRVDGNIDGMEEWDGKINGTPATVMYCSSWRTMLN